jgi:hypothetical protein
MMEDASPNKLLRWFGFASQPAQDAKPYWLTDRVLACVYGKSSGLGQAPVCQLNVQLWPAVGRHSRLHFLHTASTTAAIASCPAQPPAGFGVRLCSVRPVR